MNKRYFNKWLVLFSTAVVMLVCGAMTYYWAEKHGRLVSETPKAQPLEKVVSVSKLKSGYDVIVVGTDPEGVTAAVSAARNGLKTLLVEPRTDRDILGGLMTEGWLNTIDLNQDKLHTDLVPGGRPAVLNKGLFSEWFNMVEGTSFDVNTAANAFYDLVKKEPNIDVRMKAKAVAPILQKGGETDKVTGAEITLEDGSKHAVSAKTVIDATQDADFAAAAGVPFTEGREDVGEHNVRMAVTTVFRINNVDSGVWEKIRTRLAEDGNPDSDADDYSAWGFGEMQKYPPTPQNADRLRMRGLNIGRQNDNTALINALQIFGVDAFNPASREEAMKLAENELPHILDYMKKLYPEFANSELIGIAPELYVRETRHMKGLYRLNIVDVLDNKDQWDRVAFGAYRVDIQRTGPTDGGQEVLSPIKYAVPFRSIVPQKVDGLLVVGRSASYDTLAHGTARVIPTGMAEAQAAGVAAKLAIDNSKSFRDLSADKALIARMQDMLNNQGMELKPYKLTADSSKSLAYMGHKDYAGLRAAVYAGLATGGGDNNFHLDDPSNPMRLINHLKSLKKMYPGAFKNDGSSALKGMSDPAKQPLSLEQASYSFAQALGLGVSADRAQAELQSRKLLTDATVKGIADKSKLTNGDVYMIVHDVLVAATGWNY